MRDTIITTELSRSLVYLVAPNAGDNFWARIINGCDKVYLKDHGTLSVGLSPAGKHILTCYTPFFDSCSIPMRKLGLIHEAAHVALRHIERYMRVVAQQNDKIIRAASATIYNWAMDFAANDSIVRLEPEFERVHKPRGSDKGEWTFLLPEEWGFERGKSMEYYLQGLTRNLEEVYEQVMKAIEEMDRREKDGDEPDEEDGGNDAEQSMGMSEDSSGDEEGDEGPEGAPSQKGRKERSNKKGGRAGVGNWEEDPSLPKGLAGKAKDVPEMFDKLQEFFDRVNHENHREWMKSAEEITAEEAQSLANRMKRHSRRLAKTAREQTVREAGTLPGHIDKLIQSLLEADPEPWDWAFADLVASAISSKVIEEMAMPNQGLIHIDGLEPWPGNMLDFAFNVTWMMDSSGSMSDPEYARGVSRFNGILATNKSVKVTYVECDAAIQKEIKVDNISVPDPEELEKVKTRKGHGGTQYMSFFKRVVGADEPGDWARPSERQQEPHPKPDLVIVAGDGGVYDIPRALEQYHPGCPIIWLITPGGSEASGMSDTPPDRIIKMFHVKPEFD